MKAAYQCAFGASHFSENVNIAERSIKDEMNCASLYTSDDLGGCIRLSLACDTARALGCSLLAKAFVFSASQDTYDKCRDKFTEYISAAKAFSKEPDELEKLAEKALLCPPSHSVQYKEAYHPSYRLISKKYARALGCALEIKKLIERLKRPVVISLDGPCASGKSTISALLAYMFDADIITTDDFFLPPQKRSSERLAEPGGNLDYERFESEVINGICSREPFSYSAYRCADGSYAEKHISGTKNIIVEGSYSHRNEFRKAYDMTVFSDISPEEQLKRLKARSPDKLERFINDWIPLENKYFEFFKIKKRSDFVIPQSVPEENL